MKVPFSFLTEQFSESEEIFRRIREFLKRCDFTLGEDLQEFEKKYAAYCGAKHAIGVGSGTDALFFCLKAAGVGSGDEVITPPNSFIATTGAIVQAGARPVYVDSGADQNIDVTKIEAAIGRRTKAILPVHWAGAPADMEAVLSIAKKHSLPVIEDACQALGAEIGGARVGGFGLAAGFSTHPIKPLHVWGDGGLVVTNSDEVANKVRLWRNHGLEGRDRVTEFGYNSRFDNVHAIVGNFVFESLDQTIATRIAHCERYDRNLKNLSDFIKIPKRVSRTKHVYHLYIIEVKERDRVLQFLNSKGVEAKVHYPIPLHLQQAASSLGYRQGDFPVAERQSMQTITLPSHQYLDDKQIDYVVDCLREFYGVKA